jgi:hypothetical protein
MVDPTQSSTWDRTKECPCRGCTESRKNEKNRIVDILNRNGVQYNSKVLEEIEGL